MTLNNVVILKSDGGLGRPATGEDHISGMVFKNAKIPTAVLAAWVTATNYKVGDTVQESDLAYVCLVAHTSGTFATDLAANNWVLAPHKGVKRYESLVQAEADGIIQGHADFGRAWYHIREFFRLNETGILYTLFTPYDATYGYLLDFLKDADGKIRQVGFYAEDEPFTTAMVTGLQTVADLADAAYMPFSGFIGADTVGTALTALPDLTALDSEKVTVVIGQDGAALGKALFDSLGYSITCLGATLGAVSAASVHQSIAWLRNFNLSSDDPELDVAAFADGTLFSSVLDTTISGINDKNYVFIRKFVGTVGSYFNDSHTAIDGSNSDFATIENNRTIDKAGRVVRASVLPELNGPIYVNSDGKLREDVIEHLKSLAQNPLILMTSDSELSAFEVVINPDQLVLNTSKVVITLRLIPAGVARTIEINIGFTVKL